jgi:hypothetical protein
MDTISDTGILALLCWVLVRDIAAPLIRRLRNGKDSLRDIETDRVHQHIISVISNLHEQLVRVENHTSRLDEWHKPDSSGRQEWKNPGLTDAIKDLQQAILNLSMLIEVRMGSNPCKPAGQGDPPAKVTKSISVTIKMWSAGILAALAIVGAGWTVGRPHLEEQLDARYVRVETQQALIKQQAESTEKIISEVEDRARADKLRDIDLWILFNEYRQEQLERLPEDAKTPRDRVMLRGLIREQQLLLEQKIELEQD